MKETVLTLTNTGKCKHVRQKKRKKKTECALQLLLECEEIVILKGYHMKMKKVLGGLFRKL
jgi:hypothetical protein